MDADRTLQPLQLGRLARVALLAAFGLLALLALPGAAPAQQSLVTGLTGPDQYQSGDPATRALWFKRTVDAGAGIVRLPIEWRSVAPQRPADPTNPASYNLDSYDGVHSLDGAVRDARARGVQVLITVNHAPDWAEGPGRPTNAQPGTWKPNPSDLADFVRAVAARYSGSFDPDGSGPQAKLPAAQALEVWNEPNQEYFLSPAYEGPTPNLVSNPGFEVDTTGWGSHNTTISRSTSEHHSGVASLKVDTAGGTHDDAYSSFPVVDGNNYRLSAWVKAPSGYHYLLGANEYAPDNTFLGVGGTSEYVGTGDWQFVSLNYVARAGVGFVGLVVGQDYLWGTESANTFYVDDARAFKATPVSPDYYRGMLNASYNAVKAVNPQMLVVVGGTSPYGDPPGGPYADPNNRRIRPVQFWQQVLCVHPAGNPQVTYVRTEGCPGPALFDVFAHHPIDNTGGGPLQSGPSPDDVSTPDLARLVSVLRGAEQAGTTLPGTHPVWVTEFWWDSNPPNPVGAPLDVQAAWIEQSLYLFWKAGASVAINFEIQDATFFPDTRNGYQSGLYFNNGQPKPSLTAFRFPFVTERIDTQTLRAWGKAPEGGTLQIQQQQGSRWVKIKQLKVSKGAVFLTDLRLSGKTALRATVGASQSLVWQQN